jgi:predicted permease
MRWSDKLLLRLRSLFRRERIDHELDDELHFHLEQQIEEKLAAGLTPEEAQYAARRTIGGLAQIQEECRDMRRVNWIADFLQDVRYGLRMMRRSPTFTGVAVLSLALGIGANTAIFTLIDAVLIKMLPVKNPEKLVVISWGAKDWPRIVTSHRGSSDRINGHVSASSFSYPTFQQFRAHKQVFSDVFAFAELEQVNVSVGGHAEMASGHLVSGNYFSGLGVQALAGRTFIDQDDEVGAAPTAVISFRFWNHRFGLDPSAVGKAIAVNGAPFTIIGVTPREFFGVSSGNAPDLFIPVAMQPRVAPFWAEEYPSLFHATGACWLRAMGRLKPGVSELQARGALDVVFRQSITAGLSSLPPKEQVPTIELSPGSKGLNDLRSEFSQPLFILMTVVVLVLLIACANVANLLLARATARQKETAVRLALGAGRPRLIRQLLTESVLLAIIGGTLGLALASRGGNLLLTLVSRGETPLALNLQPDVRVLVFCLAISLLAGILFGLAPALRGTRVDLTPSLKVTAGSLGARFGRSRLRLGKVLVASQVAMSLLLLIGAGLFVRSLQKLNSIDLGFNRHNLLLFSIDGTASGYKDVRLRNVYKEIQARLQGIPGVRSVSLSRHRLIGGGASIGGVDVPGYKPRPNEEMSSWMNWVGPGFFETMGIRILVGRGLTARDGESGSKVVVINEAFARHYFPNEAPVGKRVGDDTEIVGVAKDAKFDGVRRETTPTIYLPYLQHLEAMGQMSFELRTAGNPTTIVPDVRRAVASVDGNLPLFGVKTQVQQIDDSLFEEHLFAKLVSCFGLLALLLAAIGLYGVMSFAVARRTSEIGIRVALGAQQGQVLWMVLRETMQLVAAGLCVGLPAALASTRLIRNQLFGLKPSDPFTISVATVVLVAVAVLAGYLPARRAARTDPMVALRYE